MTNETKSNSIITPHPPPHTSPSILGTSIINHEQPKSNHRNNNPNHPRSSAGGRGGRGRNNRNSGRGGRGTTRGRGKGGGRGKGDDGGGGRIDGGGGGGENQEYGEGEEGNRRRGRSGGGGGRGGGRSVRKDGSRGRGRNSRKKKDSRNDDDTTLSSNHPNQEQNANENNVENVEKIPEAYDRQHHEEEKKSERMDNFQLMKEKQRTSKSIINIEHHDEYHQTHPTPTTAPPPSSLPPPPLSAPQDPEARPSPSSTLSKINESTTAPSADSPGVIDLLKHKRHEKTDPKPPTSKSKKKKKHKKKSPPSSDHTSKISAQRLARTFNTSVRHRVERSDPDGLHALLHDKANHKYALQSDVLETVMKAFVVAAMFEEALYCLRHTSLPGTLAVLQTERILQCLPQNLRTSSAYAAADMIDALCIATDFSEATHRTYFLRIARGIALEFLEEATSARDRICSAPCERLVRSAVCVVDAKLRRGKKATELVVVPGNQLGVFVPETAENRGMQAGDAVGLLPYAGPYPMSAESLDRNMVEATVTGTQPLVIRLQDKSNTALYGMLTDGAEGNIYRVDKLANRMGFNRQLASAVALTAPIEKDANGLKIHNKSDLRRPSPELIKAITAMDENIDRAMQTGAILKTPTATPSATRQPGELTSTAALCAQPVPWDSRDEEPQEDDYLYEYTPPSNLPPNDPAHRRPEMTRTARPRRAASEIDQDHDAIRDAARLALEKYGAFEGLNPSQQLAVEGAATNRLTLVQGPPGTGKTAVAIRIIQHWARVSAGCGGSVQPILATSDSNIAVDNLVEGCANVGLRVVRLGRPEAIRPELLRYCIDRPQASNNGHHQGNNSYHKPYSSPQNTNYGPSAFKEKMKVLKNAQVVCCTCIGSGADILDNMTFERVLVDEATQATEPAVLVPLARMCRQLVLVGDHCQLPPTVLSTRAEEEGLGVPLFSRMVACGVPPFMLDTQYRMHPGIAMFPSDLFYGGKLLNGVSPPERRPLAGFPWPREEFPVAFVPVPHGQEVDDGVSKLNKEEAAAACDAVAALLAGGQCTPLDIAVVTPYAAQVRLIRRLTRKLVSSPPYVEVSSTDGFQGREKEAVVFSAVRSNDYGAVGFVSDWRRVNVSFTRARRGLVVIGNDVTLRRGDVDTWMPWLAWADAHGINMDKPGVPRGRYDAEQLRRVRGGTTAAEMLRDVLERQKRQRVSAERELMKAEKKSSGHIIGSGMESGGAGMGGVSGMDGMGGMDGINGGGMDGMGGVACHIKQNLAALSNTDGCWDDSDDDEQDNGELHHSVSVATFATTDTSNTKDGADDGDGEEPQDAWDL